MQQDTISESLVRKCNFMEIVVSIATVGMKL